MSLIDVALMMLNGIAQKVKFKGLQERAREKMDEIAAKRGMTAEQLADRLVPDLDLDDHGSKTLDFGPRSFRVGFDEGPVCLFVKKCFEKGQPFVATNAARQHRAAKRTRVQRKVAENEAHFAGVDVFRLEARVDLFVELGAVRASHRSVFDDRHFGVRCTGTEVGQIAGLHEFSDVAIGACLGVRAFAFR